MTRAPRARRGLGAAALFVTLPPASLLLLSCGDAGGPAGPTAPGPAASISITPAAARIAALEDTAQLRAEVRDASGRVVHGSAVTWSSSAPSIASVSASGVVTARAGGDAMVTARSGAADATVPVVVAQAIASVAVASPGLVFAALGDTARLTAVAQDARGHAIEGATFAWSSSDPAVATVAEVAGEGGLVTALAVGEATIDVAATDPSGGTGRGAARVVVGIASALAVAPGSVTLEAVGDTTSIRATVHGADGDLFVDAPVRWTSADPAVATVAPGGIITAVNRGATRITATSGAAAGHVAVEVTPRSLDMRPDSLSVPWPLQTRRLRVDLRDDGTGESLGPPDSVVWVSEDTTVATVDATGLVTGVRKGTVRVVATAGLKRAEAVVRVADPERDALVAFYHAMDGDNWARNDNWLTDQPIWQPPGWYGVTPVLDRTANPDAGADRLSAMLKSLAGAGVPDPLDSLAASLRAGWEAWSAGDPAAPSAAEAADAGARDRVPPWLGRIGTMTLDRNNLSGGLSGEDTWRALPFLESLDLSYNRLAGELPPSFGNTRLVRVAHNALSGPIPPALFEDPPLIGLALDGNKLSGSVPSGFLRQTYFLQLDGNELAGALPVLSEFAPNVFFATWYDNDGLCHPPDDLDPNRILLGPLCGAEPLPPANVVLEPAYVEFTALGDSVRLDVRALGDDGHRTALPALEWIIGDDRVATVTAAANGAYWVKPHANGETRIFARVAGIDEAIGGLHFDLLATPLELRVRQVPVTLDAAEEITVPAGTNLVWAVVPRDRNGYEVPLPAGTVTASADTSVAVVYRNRVLRAVSEGTSIVGTTLPGGVYNGGTVHVTATPARPLPAIDGWTPNPVMAGAPLTIGGRNLDGATVLIDGAPADIIDRTATSLTVSVPDFGGCTPQRNIAVVVRDRENLGDAVVTRLAGAGVDLSAIPPATLRGPLPIPVDSDLCLQASGGSGREEEYLVGVQALLSSEPFPPRIAFFGDPLAVEFTVGIAGSADDGAAASRVPRSPRLAPDPAPAAARTPTPGSAEDRRARHRRAEAELRAQERRTLEGLRGRPGLASASAAARAALTPAIHAGTAVGDTVPISYLGAGCAPGLPIRGVVKVVNEAVVIVADTENAADYTDARYADFGRLSRDVIMPALVRNFGPPTDVNGDGRIAMVFTDQVTRQARGLLGWVSPLNLLSKADCPGSNEMEIFFGVTPDDPRIPVQGLPLTPDILWQLLPPLIAHEATHLIQGRRFVAQEEIVSLGLEIWFAEAQAVVGEEIAGHAATGNAPGNNYGPDVAHGRDADGIPWYAGIFPDFRNYFSGAGAPAACGWWSQRSGCEGRSLWYGIGWSFMRWVLDRYGPAFPGGEAGFNTAMIDARPEGPEFGKFEALLGVDFGTLLAGWGATLYADDRLPGADPAAPHQMTSWHLPEIYGSLGIDVPTRLVGLENGTAAGDRLRAGSTMYYRVRGGPGAFPATALRIAGELVMDTAEPELFDWYRLQTFVIPLGAPTAETSRNRVRRPRYRRRHPRWTRPPRPSRRGPCCPSRLRPAGRPRATLPAAAAPRPA